MKVQAPNGLILDVPDAIATGLVGQQNHSGWEYAESDSAAPGEAVKPSIPKPYASKLEWVEYAVSRGVPQDEAESSSKNDLVKRLS